MKAIGFGLVLALVSAPLVHPWGAQGHAAIGLVAEQNLTPQTQRQVEKLLGNTDLAGIASWMDDLRGATAGFGKLAADPEARQFAKLFPKNDQWHYDDQPLDMPAYRDNGPYSRHDDVVHQINAAIDTLEGHGPAGITPRIALFMIVHFVGDIHQPLHLACGYYDLGDPQHPQLIRDPARARNLQDDKGANSLHFGPERYDELHAYWDTALPRKVAHGNDATRLAKVMMDTLSPQDAQTRGDYHRWAEIWATESIAAARDAYQGINFGPAEMDGERLRRIEITLPPDYDLKAEPIARRRLALAGYRLAQLLNSIHWNLGAASST